MFNKQREALEANAKYQKVKQHVQENQTAYMAGAGGLAVGLAVGLLFKHRPQITSIVNNVTPSIAPVFNNDNSSSVSFGGHMTKLVKCLETGEMWETVTEAAKAASFPITAMSKHLNGHTEALDGLHYAIIGLGTSQ